MKKFLAVILTLALCLTLAPAAFAAAWEPSRQTLTLDGATVDCAAVNIEGFNYFRLRDLAALLKGTDVRFDVGYDEATQTVSLTTGADYSGEIEQPPVWYLPDGMTIADIPAEESAQTVLIDGEAVTDLTAYNLGGYNYFRLRELQAYLGFAVDYDEKTDTAHIRTTGAATAVDAADYAAVYAALASTGALRRGGDERGAVEEAEAPAAAPAPDAGNYQAADSAGKGDGGDYSGTNVQVAGIDEGDIVKTDGRYIYVLHDSMELLVVKADGAATAVLSRTTVGNWTENKVENGYSYASKYAREMYVSDGRVAILSNQNSYEEYRDDTGWHYEDNSRACVDIYDCADPAAPRLVTAFGQDGYLSDSRMADGRIYVVSNYWVWDGDADDPQTFVPRVYSGKTATVLPADRVILPPVCDSSQYVVLCSYDLAAAAATDSISLLGGGDTVYMNTENLYLLRSRWTETVENSYTESVYTVREYLSSAETQICRIAFSGGALTFAGSGSVPGYLDDQFSVDEYGGYLRIVTNRNEERYRVYCDETYGFENYKWGDSTRTTGLYVLDGALQIVGSVKDLAPDERVYSARFDGSIASFCTYRQPDPLFAVDLSDPAAPKVLSALKLSGFSEYLHNWESGRLFGFGRETDEETGWSEGLKLVMFDTTDKTNVTVENSLVLDQNYSEALYNHRAFLIDAEKNIIGFPGSESYAVYAYDAAAGFSELCAIPFTDGGWNTRGLYVGAYAYIVGYTQLAVLSMNGWQPVATLDLAA